MENKADQRGSAERPKARIGATAEQVRRLVAKLKEDSEKATPKPAVK